MSHATYKHLAFTEGDEIANEGSFEVSQARLLASQETEDRTEHSVTRRRDGKDVLLLVAAAGIALGGMLVEENGLFTYLVDFLESNAGLAWWSG